MSALEIFNNIDPPCTSTVLVELFNISGQFRVEVWFRNDSNLLAAPFQMIIPG